MVRHLPCALIPVHDRALRSSDTRFVSDIPEAWCPQVAPAYAEPENNFLACLEIRASLEMRLSPCFPVRLNLSTKLFSG